MFVVDDVFGSKGRGSTFFVSYLPFQGAPAGNLADLKPFNRALAEGMRLLAAQNSNYAVNAPGHALGETDENVQKLMAILGSPYQTRGARRDRIIAELMTPNGIDGLVTGTFRQDERGSIVVRTILVSKASMRILELAHRFEKEDLSAPTLLIRAREPCVMPRSMKSANSRTCSIWTSA